MFAQGNWRALVPQSLVPIPSLADLAEQHLGLAGQRVRAVHVARVQCGLRLLEELPDLRGRFLFLVAQLAPHAAHPAFDRRDRVLRLPPQVRWFA